MAIAPTGSRFFLPLLFLLPAACSSSAAEDETSPSMNEAAAPVAHGMEGEQPVAHSPGGCTLCDVYHDARTYVLRIHTAQGQGAGVVVHKDGWIATNDHVLGSGTRIQVESADGRNFSARILRRDADLDLAIIQVDAPDVTRTVATLANGRLPSVGTDVYVIGHPLGLGWTVSRGIVSGVRSAGEVSRVAMIQTDAAISPGNSGGPLLDGQGRILGIVTAKFVGPGSDNLAFAIPAGVLKAFLEDLEADIRRQGK